MTIYEQLIKAVEEVGANDIPKESRYAYSANENMYDYAKKYYEGTSVMVVKLPKYKGGSL